MINTVLTSHLKEKEVHKYMISCFNIVCQNKQPVFFFFSMPHTLHLELYKNWFNLLTIKQWNLGVKFVGSNSQPSNMPATSRTLLLLHGCDFMEDTALGQDQQSLFFQHMWYDFLKRRAVHFQKTKTLSVLDEF